MPGDLEEESLLTSESGSRYMTVETTEGRMPLLDAVRRNLPAAVTVAIVSLSLSIALGIASGAGPQAGLSTAVWGGIAGGLFASSHYNIIGPAGALAPLLSSYALQWGPEILPWLSAGSAVLVFATHATGLQRYMLIMPTAVFEGFTLAVALSIGLGQIPAGFGLAAPHHAHFLPNLLESLGRLPEAKAASALVFVPEALGMYLLLRRMPRVPWMALVPLASLPLGWLGEANPLWGLPTLRSRYGTLSPQLFQPPSLAVLSALPPDQLPSLAIAACSVAAVAVLETLISAKIAAARAGNHFDEAQETHGLGIAHAACALAGAMPPTGVFVRTSLNLSLGAVHRSAQLMQALLVGLVTLLAMPLFQNMPLPTIAAVLAVAAARMCPSAFLHDAYLHARPELCICLLTAALAVSADMILGLLVGTVVALLRNAALTSQAPLLVQHAVLPKSEHQLGGVRDTGSATSLTVVGAVTYINAHEVASRGRASPYAAGHITVARTLLDLRSVIHTDWEGLGALHSLLLQLDSAAFDGASVVGPDGVEVPARDVADKLALDAILRSVPQRAQLGLG